MAFKVDHFVQDMVADGRRPRRRIRMIGLSRGLVDKRVASLWMVIKLINDCVHRSEITPKVPLYLLQVFTE